LDIHTINNNKGFTLAMVSIWLLVISITATVALSNPETEKIIHKEAAYKKIITEYSVAISRFIWLNKRNPESIEELANSNPPVLRRLYDDPFTGNTSSWTMVSRLKMPPVIVSGSGVVSGNGSPCSTWWVDKNLILHETLE
jgi:competence protein ComGC